jgi:hypothetical protein
MRHGRARMGAFVNRARRFFSLLAAGSVATGSRPAPGLRSLGQRRDVGERSLVKAEAAGGGGRGCAWHGHWIGGESPSRGEVVATASRRQLHAVPAVVRRQRWRREVVWGRSPRRTAAPNASEPLSKPDRPGQRVFERDAQNPSEAGAVLGAGAAGHSVSLPREVCVGPP